MLPYSSTYIFVVPISYLFPILCSVFKALLRHWICVHCKKSNRGSMLNILTVNLLVLELSLLCNIRGLCNLGSWLIFGNCIFHNSNFNLFKLKHTAKQILNALQDLDFGSQAFWGQKLFFDIFLYTANNDTKASKYHYKIVSQCFS